MELELESYCAHSKRPTARAVRESAADTLAVIHRAARESHSSERAEEYIDTACRMEKVGFIRHLPLDQVVHDRSVQSLLLGVMYNSMKPAFKETAVFALGAAGNYDWMTYDWLQCNRPFLASPTNAWKSVLMVECQMKIDERRRELARFRDALQEFAATLPQPKLPIPSVHEPQSSFSFLTDDALAEVRTGAETRATGRDHRLGQRVKVLLDAAS